MTNLARHPRYDQIFPVLGPRDIERLKRFGKSLTYPAGAQIAKTGSLAPGFVVLVSGKVEVSQQTALDQREIIVTYQAGQFTGELAQLSNDRRWSTWSLSRTSRRFSSHRSASATCSCRRRRWASA